MKQFPNLIIAGAPKSGTSSLFFWLGAHPEVCASKVKETYFLGDKVNRFNKDLNIHDHGWEAYSRHFEHCSGQKYRVEATPVYIYHQEPFKHFDKFPEMPKVIFILRRPGDRLYSLWRFNRYRMKNTRMSFEEYLDYEKNAPKHWVNYLEHTRYVDFIKPWVDRLGKERVFVYQFEKLVRDKKTFMAKIASDLGIDPDFYQSYDFFHRNETVAIFNKKLHRLGLKVEPYIPQYLQEKIIPLYLKLNSKKAPAITEREKQLRADVNENYRSANEELANIFPEIDLELW